jgi:hypothetical protein
MSFIKIYREDWSKLIKPTIGSIYVGYDVSDTWGYGVNTLLQMDDNGVVTPIGGSGSGSVIYINEDPVPVTLGGVEQGTSFPPPGNSMKEMWDMLLYPYLNPGFTSFYFDENSNKEVGYSFNSTISHWDTSHQDNITDYSISIQGYNLTPLTGLDKNGFTTLLFSSSVTSNDVGSRNWTISGVNTKSQTFNSDYTIDWNWKWYWGSSSSVFLSETEIESLQSDGLYSGYNRTFTMPMNNYKYLCFADTYGGPSSFVDGGTGLGIAMYNGYSNSENGFTYDLVSVTNIYSETTNYRVYRTQNKVTDSFEMEVS